jgi:hypothetical protein
MADIDVSESVEKPASIRMLDRFIIPVDLLVKIVATQAVIMEWWQGLVLK